MLSHSAMSDLPSSPERLRFDRGTILLDRPVDAPGVRFDARVGAHRAPAWRYADLKAEIPVARRLVDELAPLIERPAGLSPPALRPYQSAAVAAWEGGRRRGVVVLPPGGGKTHLALAAMARLGRTTIVLVPTRALLVHWRQHLERAGPTAGVGVVGDGAQRLAPITVCTYQSAFERMDLFGDRFGLLVVDEVHNLGRTLRPEALEMCAAPARLGLTGTPPTRREALCLLEQLVGPVVSVHRVEELGRHLAPYDREVVLVRLTAEERRDYARAYAAHLARANRALCLGRGPRPGQAELQRARRVLAMAAGKLSAAASLLELHREDRALVFTADNTAAYRLSRQLLIPAVTCDIARPEREALFAALEGGRLRALVSARVLNEGLDLPDCRVGIVLAGSDGSERERQQRLGRLLRPAPGKRAVLYEVLAAGTFEARGRRR
jgi:superfamily II DNA or RNA helicase